MRMMMSKDEEDEFRSTAEEGVDPSLDEARHIYRSEIARRLGEVESSSVNGKYQKAFFHLDWAEGLENSTVNLIKFMDGKSDCCRRGAAHFAAKEPALAETLRGTAAWSDVAVAGLVEVAASVRHLRGVCLRQLAEAVKEDIVCEAAADYLEHVAAAYYYYHDGDAIPPVYPYWAVADQVYAAVVVAGASYPGARSFVEGFAERAGRLRRGAAEFGGAEAVKLMEHAAIVDEVCADTETFLHKIVSSVYLEMWTHIIGRWKQLLEHRCRWTTRRLSERSD